jgi:hypothetical protein
MATWNSSDPRPALPPFSGANSVCPKCGARSPFVRYIERAALAQYGTVAYRHARDDDFPCIQRTCGTCGFATLEAPLSASDALTAPPPDIEKIREMNAGAIEGMA